MITDIPKMHYVASSVPDHEAIKERGPNPSTKAGSKRTIFVAESIGFNSVLIVQGPGNKPGIFNAKKQSLTKNVSVYYLPLVNLFLFGKSVSKFFFSWSLFVYLLKEVKKGEWVMLYNCNIFQVLPVVLAKWIKRFKFILHIEEIYSYERVRIRKFAQNIASNNSNGLLTVNKEIVEYINYSKPYLITRGYGTYKDEYINHYSEINKPVLLYSGRLEYLGGAELILEAIPFIKKECKLVVCGIGILDSKFENYISTNSNVEYEYVGLLSDEKYYNILINSNIGLNPIRTNEAFSQLSFPSKILQYLEFGCQVVSSYIPAVEELGELKKYIIDYKHDTGAELADAINRSLELTVNKHEIIAEMKEHFIQERSKLSSFFQKMNQ
ncbi:MAG: glycosyltransferase [Bacteroidia bacterium]|nr:glycosyltransferase [Bacteroidia bacterium]